MAIRYAEVAKAEHECEALGLTPVTDYREPEYDGDVYCVVSSVETDPECMGHPLFTTVLR